MKTRTIEVIVSATGDIKIDAVGFKGADCEQATKFLEEALGTVQHRQRKPEFLRSKTNLQQKIGQ